MPEPKPIYGTEQKKNDAAQPGIGKLTYVENVNSLSFFEQPTELSYRFSA